MFKACLSLLWFSVPWLFILGCMHWFKSCAVHLQRVFCEHSWKGLFRTGFGRRGGGDGEGDGGAPPKESLFNPVHSCLLLSTQQISWTKELFSLSLHFHIWHILESASYVIRFPSQQGQLSKNRLGQARAECPSLDICGRELTCLFSCRSLQCLM